MSTTQEYQDDMKARIVDIDFDTSLLKQFILLGGEVKKDGNMFGAIIGTMPIDYCGDFKKTRAAAVSGCMHNWYNEQA